jgi:Ca-activated chloride channel homolog
MSARRIFPRGKGLALCVAAALCAACCLAFGQQAPVFRTDVTLVRVIATVKTEAGLLVGSLGKDDFEIFDNGAPQEIAVFERQTEQPLNVALMVDTSGSAAKDLKQETDSAARFLRALLSEGGGRDAAALYSFNADVTQHQGFTSNLTTLLARFKEFRAEGATALYDALRWGAQALEPREGRKVIVVVTDGDSTYSSVTAHDALEAAQLAEAAIYPVVVVPITSDAGRNTGGEHALIFLAQGTGGRTYEAALGPALDKAFADIVSELRTQYFLAFYPKNAPLSKNRYHKLEVRLKRPELRVSAPTGYYGEVDSGPPAADARVAVEPERPKPAPAPAKSKGRQER